MRSDGLARIQYHWCALSGHNDPMMCREKIMWRHMRRCHLQAKERDSRGTCLIPDLVPRLWGDWSLLFQPRVHGALLWQSEQVHTSTQINSGNFLAFVIGRLRAGSRGRNIWGRTGVVKVPRALSPRSFPLSLVASQPAVAASFQAAISIESLPNFHVPTVWKDQTGPAPGQRHLQTSCCIAGKCGPWMSRLGPLRIPVLRGCVGKGGGCTEGGTEQTEPIQVC